MYKATLIFLFFFPLFAGIVPCQTQGSISALSVKDSTGPSFINGTQEEKFTATVEFLDAAINSINSFNSIINKENYRSKIASLNNPTSSEMGFNLETEIQTALKPLLAKARTVNTDKFSQIVSSLVNTSAKAGPTISKTSLLGVDPLYSTVISLVGNLVVQEKKITRTDLDSFILATSKYFVQYEKLNNANAVFDQNISRLNGRFKDLQFDLKEYLLDMVTVLSKDVPRNTLKNMDAEAVFLKYLGKEKIQVRFANQLNPEELYYPSDGIKGAKEIAGNLQKLFIEYQKIYTENFQQIRAILLDARTLGQNINVRQVDSSLKELEELYNDSKKADVLGLRLNTLTERLKALVVTEQRAK